MWRRNNAARKGCSRLLEAGWPLHHVQEMLGHSSLEHTSTYLNIQRGGLRESMRRVYEIRSRCNPVVIDGEVGLPFTHNARERDGGKVTVN